MELIKKIKEAEAQSQEIVEQAKAKAAADAEEARKKRAALQAEAEQARRKAIDAATAEAKSQGQAEAGGLKVDADSQRDRLREETGGKMGPAIDKVVNYLRG
jgi:vacuolar-type H+-ATPase subunit H